MHKIKKGSRRVIDCHQQPLCELLIDDNGRNHQRRLKHDIKTQGKTTMLYQSSIGLHYTSYNGGDRSEIQLQLEKLLKENDLFRSVNKEESGKLKQKIVDKLLFQGTKIIPKLQPDEKFSGFDAKALKCISESIRKCLQNQQVRQRYDQSSKRIQSLLNLSLTRLTTASVSANNQNMFQQNNQ